MATNMELTVELAKAVLENKHLLGMNVDQTAENVSQFIEIVFKRINSVDPPATPE
jgi:hypothetical protein